MASSKKFLKEGYKAGEGESLQEKEPASINEGYNYFKANVLSPSYEGYQPTKDYGLSDNLYKDIFGTMPPTAQSPAKNTDIATKNSDKPISLLDIPNIQWPESLAPIRNAHDEPVETATIAPVVDYAVIDYGPYGDYPVTIDKYYHRFYSNNILDSPKNEPSSSIPNHGYGNRQSPARYEQRYCGNGPPKSRNNNYRSVNFERPFSTEKKVSKTIEWPESVAPIRNAHDEPVETVPTAVKTKKSLLGPATIAPVVKPYIDYDPYTDYPVSDIYQHRIYPNIIPDPPKNEPSSSIPNPGYGNRRIPARNGGRYFENGQPKSRNNFLSGDCPFFNFERPFSTEKKVFMDGHDDRFYSPVKKRFEKSRVTDRSSSFAKKKFGSSRPVDRFTLPTKKEFGRRRLDGCSSPYKMPEFDKISHNDRTRPKKDYEVSDEYQNKYPKNYGRNERKPYDRRYRQGGYSFS